MRRAGLAALALGTLAAGAGIAFLWNVGALPGMASLNLVSFALGLLLGWITHRLAHWRHGSAILFALGCAFLVLVLVAGVEAGGVRRWIPVGPFHLQPALIVAPLLLAIAASREGRHWRAAILLPLLLIAFQPDAATLFAMTAGVIGMLASASAQSRRGWSLRRIGIASGAAVLAGLGIAFAGIQTPPPVAFVEGTIRIAQLSGPVAILFHVAALGLALIALLSAEPRTGAALAAYFAVAAAAAIFWAFPMPIVGAGPSHMVGFGLAIGWLATRDRARQALAARG